MGTVLQFKPRPEAKRTLSPAKIAAPAFMAGIVGLTIYATAVMCAASLASATLNIWRK